MKRFGIDTLKTFLHKLVTNPLDLDLDPGPLRDYECPRCHREWKDQWGGETPDQEPVIYFCSVCCKEFGIDPDAKLIRENYTMALNNGFVLKIKRADTPNFFASLEQRFSR